MRTVRSSGRISGGGCVYLPGGVLAQGGVPGPGGTWSGGEVYLARGVPGPGGYSSPCGQTHACKNITFATSLRTVKKRFMIFTSSYGQHQENFERH